MNDQDRLDLLSCLQEVRAEGPNSPDEDEFYALELDEEALDSLIKLLQESH